MHLLRFAILSLHGAADQWRTFTTEREGVVVSTLHHWAPADGRISIVLVADAPLERLPTTNESGLVLVPEAPRRLAEEAIERTADLVSVATGHARSLSSLRFVVALRAETDDERQWFRVQRDIATAEQGVATGRLTVAFDESDLVHVFDREDGVALMGEALAQSHSVGRYRELLRVFEMAFKSSADRLVPRLASFLEGRPGLGYSKTEVKRWIVRLRGPAMHADRHDALLEADLRPVLDRMLLAAYEVLFNKRIWRSADSDRRDAWTPSIGPLDPHGRWFVLQHSAPTLSVQLYDAFGAYVLDTDAPVFQLGEDCWPRRPPSKVTARQADVEIIPAERLAVLLPPIPIESWDQRRACDFVLTERRSD